MITVPIPPSVNHTYGIRQGRLYKTAKAREWQDLVRSLAYAWSAKHGWGEKAEKVVVELTVYWPDRRRRDLHNLHKLIADALEGVVYTDDRFALVRDMDYRIDREDPRLEIEWRLYDDPRSL